MKALRPLACEVLEKDLSRRDDLVKLLQGVIRQINQVDFKFQPVDDIEPIYRPGNRLATIVEHIGRANPKRADQPEQKPHWTDNPRYRVTRFFTELCDKIEAGEPMPSIAQYVADASTKEAIDFDELLGKFNFWFVADQVFAREAMDSLSTPRLAAIALTLKIRSAFTQL